MKFVLIILLFKYNSAATVTADFSTEAACKAAGTALVVDATAKSTGHSITWGCYAKY